LHLYTGDPFTCEKTRKKKKKKKNIRFIKRTEQKYHFTPIKQNIVAHGFSGGKKASV
jgi:hypothetical protein